MIKKLIKTSLISGFVLISMSNAVELIQPVDFNKYPLPKTYTAESRGGDLPDKIAATDGIGDLIFVPVDKKANNISNKEYNKVIYSNINKLDDNNTINDLITNNIVTIPEYILNKINNILSDNNTTQGNSNTITCGEGEGVTIDELKDMIANNEDVTNVCTSNITDMSYLFKDNSTFNQDISNWDVSNVTNMSYMFYNADSFNQDLDSWDTSKVTNMNSMFRYNDAFNQDIGNWDTTNVTNMDYMFSNTTQFNQNLTGWNVENVTSHTNFNYSSVLEDSNCPIFPDN